MFDDVLEFSDISGKIIIQQESQGLIGNAGDLFSHSCVELLDERIINKGMSSVSGIGAAGRS